MRLFLLSVGVSLDATAVAAAFALRRPSIGTVLRLAVAFGLFQAGMALAGSFGGQQAIRYTAAWDHWLALLLLAFVGGKMIVDSIRGGEPARGKERLTWMMLLLLAVATSIDSLVVGVTLPILGLPAIRSSIAIGSVTFALSLAGALAGRRLGAAFGRWVGVVGGMILVAIGIWTVWEHA